MPERKDTGNTGHKIKESVVVYRMLWATTRLSSTADGKGQKYALKISPDPDVSPTAKQTPPVTPTHLLHPHRASKSSPPMEAVQQPI